MADATPAMRTAQDKTFGPVMLLFRFETDGEAIAIANDTEFGTESGMLGINCGLISNEVAPGWGIECGLGSQGSHLGIDEYVEVKYLCWDGLDMA